MYKGKFKVRRGYFKEALVTTDKTTGSMYLELPQVDEQTLRTQLPHVSIITITKNRGMFIGTMLYNWMNIKYPREKLEWIIVDDSDNTEYNIAEYIPENDPYIRYIKLDRHYNVDEKRNKAVELAKYNYLVHMDDDDYYFPDHVLMKMRLMMHYGKQGVLSMPIGVYDLMERSSYIFNTNKTSTQFDTNNIAEATLAYTREYWQNNKFESCEVNGISEGRAFVNKHFDKFVRVHFLFNMISITHTKNITGHGRRLINENTDIKVGNFEDVFPQDYNTLLDNIRKILAPTYQKPNI